MARSLTLLCLIAACSVDPSDGQFLCPDGECPEGQFCVSGTCRDEPGESDLGATDGGTEDLGTPDAASDLGCPGTEELCTGPGTPLGDEDCDGAVDEGCGWHFGPAHLVVDGLAGAFNHWSPAVANAAGTELVFGYSDPSPGTVMHALRSSPADRFGRATPIGTQPTTDPIFVVSMSADARLVVAQSGGQLLMAERASEFDTFGGWVPIGEGFHPAVAPNGLELVYRDAVDRLQLRRRSDRELPFGEPVAAVTGLTDPANFPTLTSDGLSLFFQAGAEFRVATRDALGVPFTEGGSITGLPAGAFPPAIRLDTREAFFARAPTDGDPTTQGIWRAEVCRDGPCPDPTPIPCEGGERTDDGLHCGWLETDERVYGAADEVCAAAHPGSVPASVHSRDEQAFWQRIRGAAARVWIGGDRLGSGEFTWLTDEPFIEFSGAFAVTPAGPSDNCLALGSTGWIATTCSTVEPVVCETSLWPTW